MMKIAQDLISELQGKKHIIWDWNGTLLSDVDYAVATVNNFLQEHDLPLVDVHSYRKVFDFPVSKYYQNLGFDFDKESFESLCHRYVDKYMQGVWELAVFPEMKYVLNELHLEGRMQSILSASDQQSLDKIVAHFNLSPLFTHVYGIADKMAASKVDRGRQLLDLVAISREDTVIVGDTLHDLEVGDALGIDAVLVAHGHQCPTRLFAKHSKVIAPQK